MSTEHCSKYNFFNLSDVIGLSVVMLKFPHNHNVLRFFNEEISSRFVNLLPPQYNFSKLTRLEISLRFVKRLLSQYNFFNLVREEIPSRLVNLLPS